MSAGLILNLLNELNKSTCILCKPLASIISFYSMSSVIYSRTLNLTKKDPFSPTHNILVL